MIQKAIEQALKILIGQRLVGTNRVINMECLKFESVPKIENLHECRLNIQANWRFIQNRTIIVGNKDLYNTPSHVEWSPDFDYELFNLRDEKLANLLKGSTLEVAAVQSNPIGDLFIHFQNGAELQIMAMSCAASYRNEYWRFIVNRTTGTSHFTMNGKGIER